MVFGWIILKQWIQYKRLFIEKNKIFGQNDHTASDILAVVARVSGWCRRDISGVILAQR